VNGIRAWRSLRDRTYSPLCFRAHHPGRVFTKATTIHRYRSTVMAVQSQQLQVPIALYTPSSPSSCFAKECRLSGCVAPKRFRVLSTKDVQPPTEFVTVAPYHPLERCAQYTYSGPRGTYVIIIEDDDGDGRSPLRTTHTTSAKLWGPLVVVILDHHHERLSAASLALLNLRRLSESLNLNETIALRLMAFCGKT